LFRQGLCPKQVVWLYMRAPYPLSCHAAGARRVPLPPHLRDRDHTSVGSWGALRCGTWSWPYGHPATVREERSGGPLVLAGLESPWCWSAAKSLADSDNPGAGGSL